MSAAVFAIPGDLGTPTGGYAYARRLLAVLPGLRHLPLPGGFPDPTPAEVEETARRLSALGPDRPVLIDGLACGALPARVIDAIAAPIVALVHHPLALESGLDAGRRRTLLAGERQALARVRHVIVTSRSTAATVAALFDVAPAAITVAEPGTDPAPRAAGQGDPPHLLAVGTVTPRKGYDLLVAALAALSGLDWHCTVAGSLDRDPAAAAALKESIAAASLAARIHLAGALSEAMLAALYARADLFVLPSRHEGYGMAFAEAMARGLPIVAAAAGAVPHTVPESAGLLVPAEDAPALAGALARLIGDSAARRRLADGAWAHGQTLPRWERTAAVVAGVLAEVSP